MTFEIKVPELHDDYRIGHLRCRCINGLTRLPNSDGQGDGLGEGANSGGAWGKGRGIKDNYIGGNGRGSFQGKGGIGCLNGSNRDKLLVGEVALTF